MRAVASAGPYARGAAGYWQHGWAPIPLPVGRKFPPEDGWTGGNKQHSGEMPSGDQVQLWISTHSDGNIALRLPKNVVGIDVDCYDGKSGAETLAAGEQEWGALPATWISTSRTDGSGIRFFRVPPGLAWPGKLPFGGGVELIRWDHRYAVAAPSTNPINNNEEYFWLDPEGNNTTEADGWEFPAVEELPEMPSEWVQGLTGGKPWVAREEADLDPEEVRAWLVERGDKPLCSVMERTLGKRLEGIRKAGPDGGAHDAVRDAVWAIIGDSAGGHAGVRKALTRVQLAFKEAVKGRRSAKEVTKEWRSFVAGGVRKVAAEGDPEEEDICDQVATSQPARVPRGGGVGVAGGSGSFDYSRDDAGNARRFVTRYRDSVRFVEALGGWHVWDRNVWRLDRDGEVMRMALATVSAMEQEANYIEEEKERARFRSFIRSSSSLGKLKAMIDLAAALKGMTVSGEQFDANARVLVVQNGTIELLASGARFRPSRQEDYNTMAVPVEYRPAAVSDLWDKFLLRAIPDPELRDWVQRAAGYSLLGANPERLFFIIEGRTSSGKSTFVEAIRSVLGPYGATFELNLFRTQKEQGPNVQLVRLLPKRFVIASEASAEQFLHADQLKRITGSEAVSARLNRANEMIERLPAFTPWLATNAAPTIRGADQALYRRMFTVPFNETIPVEEELADLGSRLRAEAGEAILSWLVEGWKSYTLAGLRGMPSAVVNATMKTREELSDFDVWLNEECERSAELATTTAELYDSYRFWCSDAEVRPESKVEFGRLMSKRGIEPKMIRTSATERDRKARGWVGIGLRGSSERRSVN